MNEHKYHDEEIRRYLLGVLPAAETERFDELSFVDDEFANALKISEKDLLDAYVQGELTREQSQQFKIRYLASATGREKIQFAQALRDWSEKRAPSTEVSSPEVKAKRRDTGWWSGFLAGPRWAWGFAAAAVLLLVAGGLLTLQNRGLRQQMSQQQARHDDLVLREQQLQKEIDAQRSASAQARQELARIQDERERLEQELKTRGPQLPGEGSVVTLILTPTMRGGGQLSSVTISQETKQVAAELQLEPGNYSTYRVMLIDPSGNQILWRSGRLKPRMKGESRSLGVSFPAGLLKPQNYILQVTGVPAGGRAEIVGDYSFKVVKE